MITQHLAEYTQQKWSIDNLGRTDRNGDLIEFHLTFAEWLDIWKLSGKLPLRGCGAGMYCMARYNDIGHYEPGNVKIILHTENISEGHKGKTPWNLGIKHKDSTRAKMRAKAIYHPVEIYGVAYKGINDAAAAHSVSRQTINNWIKSGKAVRQ